VMTSSEVIGISIAPFLTDPYLASPNLVTETGKSNFLHGAYHIS
jgi:hypothetical protein